MVAAYLSLHGDFMAGVALSAMCGCFAADPCIDQRLRGHLFSRRAFGDDFVAGTSIEHPCDGPLVDGPESVDRWI